MNLTAPPPPGTVPSIATTLADRGESVDALWFIVAAVSTTDGYGNDTETDLYLELYKHLRTNFNTGPLFWYGASMGALTMFNAISHREWPTPAAAAAVGGAYSLRGVYDLPALAGALAGRPDVLARPGSPAVSPR